MLDQEKNCDDNFTKKPPLSSRASRDTKITINQSRVDGVSESVSKRISDFNQ